MATPPYSNKLSNAVADPWSCPEPPPPWKSAHDPGLGEVRRAYRMFVSTTMVLSVGSFFLYVMLSCFAPGFMDVRIAGHFTLGLIVGLAQFAVMAVTGAYYAAHMRNRVEPIVDRLRAEGQRSAAHEEPAAAPAAGERPAWW